VLASPVSSAIIAAAGSWDTLKFFRHSCESGFEVDRCWFGRGFDMCGCSKQHQASQVNKLHQHIGYGLLSIPGSLVLEQIDLSHVKEEGGSIN
jgi:hypothetical protein